MIRFPLLLIAIAATILISCSKEGANTIEPIINKAPTYTVTIEAGEGGVVSTSGGSFNKDSQVSVTATPDAEYLFESWSDGNTDNPRSFTVSSSFTVTANFVKKQYDLSITVVGEGSVIEQVMVQGGKYNSGSQIKLTATATEGWTFINWSGAIESIENPSTISVNGDLEIIATFLEDADGDGIPNTTDQCPDTPSGEQVDENGCSDSQKDTDEDGVTDDLDQCPNTPSGEAVDKNGCSESQKDTDQDGVTDDLDQCPSTPNGEAVDEKGCELKTYVPDDSFESILITLGYDDVLDDYVKTKNIESIRDLQLDYTTLSVFTPPISSLVGLEDFKNLKRFHLGIKNNITEFNFPELEVLEVLTLTKTSLNDLTLNHPNLYALGFENNQFDTSLDISQCLMLDRVSASKSNIIKVTLPKRSRLRYLDLQNNKLSSIDISDMNNLEYAYINNNDLDAFSTNGNTRRIIQLRVQGNSNLKNVNVSNISELQQLYLNDCDIESLDVSNNTKLSALRVFGNPLTCIKVNQDQLGSIPNGWDKDPDTNYSLNCN